MQPTLKTIQCRNRRLEEKFNAINNLRVSLYFVTMTLDEKGGKDRYKQQTIIDATRRAIKKAHASYYIMIYETHKDGAWHAHLIAPILDAQKIYNNYTAGYVKFETVHSSTYNELAKYLAKQPKGKRSIYCSCNLNNAIRQTKRTTRRNAINESKFNQGVI